MHELLANIPFGDTRKLVAAIEALTAQNEPYKPAPDWEIDYSRAVLEGMSPGEIERLLGLQHQDLTEKYPQEIWRNKPPLALTVAKVYSRLGHGEAVSNALINRHKIGDSSTFLIPSLSYKDGFTHFAVATMAAIRADATSISSLLLAPYNQAVYSSCDMVNRGGTEVCASALREMKQALKSSLFKPLELVLKNKKNG